MQSIVLNPKFDPYILNRATESQLIALRKRLDEIFSRCVTSEQLEKGGFKPVSLEKKHILTHHRLPGWLIKAERKDYYHCCADQHLYRVRKTTRIQKVIDKYHLTTVVVPKKYLYEYKGQWFVIAQAMDLEPKIKIDSVPWEKEVPNEQLRDLTPQQARELAILCYEAGLPDMGAHNLAFLRTGEICTFDTEPLTRGLKKELKEQLSPEYKIMIDYALAKANADRLYRICHDPEAQVAVRQVQKEMGLKHVAKLTHQTTLPLLSTNHPSPPTRGVGKALIQSSLNVMINAKLLMLSLFIEQLIGSVAYEGDLIEAYRRK
jgi:hypothetical protein